MRGLDGILTALKLPAAVVGAVVLDGELDLQSMPSGAAGRAELMGSQQEIFRDPDRDHAASRALSNAANSVVPLGCRSSLATIASCPSASMTPIGRVSSTNRIPGASRTGPDTRRPAPTAADESRARSREESARSEPVAKASVRFPSARHCARTTSETWRSASLIRMLNAR